MGTQVDAATIKAGQLFATSTFHIPDFQREYSWGASDEVADFWSDLRESIESPPFFLGLLIITDERGVKTVVDGQQRLVTLSLLANSIRKAAESRGKALVADSMRDVFLYAVDYDRNARVPRVNFASRRDHESLTLALAYEAAPAGAPVNQRLLDAQAYLDRALENDLSSGDATAQLARWAHYLATGITFATFEHPDRSAAYKVFEIVNTRGKDLTPAELIKSFIIGSAASTEQDAVYSAWNGLEERFRDVTPEPQLTQFIRNVVTLRHGYVEPSDLYAAISSEYAGPDGVRRLLQELDDELPLHLQLLNPPLDDADPVLRSFSVLSQLGLRTVRPAFLATAHATQTSEGFQELFRIIIPRLVTGTFGTGSVERQFAEAARDIYTTNDWRRGIERLGGLIPPRELFTERLQNRGQNKGVLLAVRAGILQDAPIPRVDGYIHQVRPRNADDWPGFSDDEFVELGGTVGNAIVCEVERRPRNTNSLAGAVERLLPTAVGFEDPQVRGATSWPAERVRQRNASLAEAGARVWYG